MAINNKFVTSFSELYIGPETLSDNPTASAIRGFFATATTAAAVGSVAAGASVHIVDTTGLKINFKNDTAGSVTLAAGDIVDATALDAKLTFTGAQVPLVAEIGTLSNEATVIDTPEFGKVFKGKLRGQLDGGSMDAQLYWAPRNFIHVKMREYATNGNAVTFGIKWKPSADAAAANSELVVFDGFVSSFAIDTAFDDVAKASTTLVVDGAEHFATGA